MWQKVLIVTVALVVTAMAVPPRAHAATFHVNSEIDSVDVNPGDGTCLDAFGKCSLRAAIMEANARAGADTIHLPAGIHTLRLARGADDTDGTGDLDIRDHLTITGSGGNREGAPSATIIQAGDDYGLGVDKVMHINPDWSTPLNVVIEAVTIRYGTNTQPYEDLDSFGGGIDWEASGTGTLTIYNSVIADNFTGEGDGGGIVAANGRGDSGSPFLRIEKTVISGNRVNDGVGAGLAIGAGVPFLIVDSQIINNETGIDNDHQRVQQGAGIYIFNEDDSAPASLYNGQYEIRNTTIAGNRARGTTGDGAGIYSDQKLTIINSTISGNTAEGFGGGIVSFLEHGDTLTMTNVTISNNAAYGNGGGLVQLHPSLSGTLPSTVLSHVTIASNVADANNDTVGEGGGIWKGNGNGTVTLRNTIVAANTDSSSSNYDNLKVTLDGASHNNLIGTGDAGGLVHNVNGNLVGIADPGLLPLANNGGPSQTRALLVGSPALDAGGTYAGQPPEDQRGLARLLDAADEDATDEPDIGAFEAHPMVENISDKTTWEDDPITFTIHVGDDDLGIDSVTGTSSNQTLVPDGNIAISGGGSTRTVTITPAPDQHGTAVISVTALDNHGGVNQVVTDTFILTVKPRPNLAVTKTGGPFRQGQTNASYTITVNNIGPGATDTTEGGPVTASIFLPADLTLVGVNGGADWTCTTSPLQCTTTKDIGAMGGVYSDITLTVNVDDYAAASVVTTVNVGGGMDNSPDNNTSNTPTTVVQVADLTVTKSHTGDFREGQQNATYTVTVNNIGPGPTDAQVTVTETVPPGMTLVSMSGLGWNCSTGGNTCGTLDPRPAGSSYPPITVTVSLANDTDPTLTNQVAVSGGGEHAQRTTNNTASDPATVVQVADMTVTKVANDTFEQGSELESYTLTVRNDGDGPTDADYTVTDTLPAGVTATSYSVTDPHWNCTLGQPFTCTGSKVLNPGDTDTITIFVSVARDAALSVTNQATASGGGEAETSNNSTSLTHSIEDVNFAPEMTAIANQSSAETDVINLQVVATDIDNDTLTYSSTALPDGLTLNTSTGVISGTLSYTSANSYTVTVTVMDQGNLSDQKSFTWTVDNTNRLPAFTAAATNTAQTIDEGQGLTAMAAADADNETLTFALAADSGALPEGISLNPDGTFAGTASPTSSGNYAAKIEVTDGIDTVSTNLSITVNNKADLTIDKSHSGDFRAGQTGAAYNIVVSNATGAGDTVGTVTVIDFLPTDFTPTDLRGDGWTCHVGTLTCSRTDTLAGGASYPPITLTVDVKTTAGTSADNFVSVSGGGDVVNTNNNDTDTTTIDHKPDLTVDVNHTGNLRQGQAGATYTIQVSNVSLTEATTAPVSITVTLPTGLTDAVLDGGPSWACTGLTCTHADPLAINTAAPAITLTVNVANDAPPTLTTQATVSGGGEVYTDNNTDSDATTVVQVADLTVDKDHSGTFTQGAPGMFTFVVANVGPGPTDAAVTLVDTLPPGWTATDYGGTGWSCNLGTATCTSSDVLAAGASYPELTLTVQVYDYAAPSVNNTATVSMSGELNTGNNSDTHTVTVTQRPELRLVKSHTDTFTEGRTASYIYAVTNHGYGFTSGTVTVTDTLPASMTAQSYTGDGWTCALGATVSCSRSDALAAGDSYPNLVLTVRVADDAPTSENSTASVSGGGDTDTANNTDDDPTTIVQVQDLTVTKTHTGNFREGQVGATYTILVQNVGGLPTTAPIILVDTLPAELTATAIDGGADWSCVLGTLTCTYANALAGAATASPITVTVTVPHNAPATVINQADVSGGGEVYIANNHADDITNITQVADLTLTIAPDGAFTQSDTGHTYTLTVRNEGDGPSDADITVSGTLTTGLTATAIDGGADWTCDLGTLTCTRTAPLATDAISTITLTVDVADRAPGTTTADFSVSGGGEVVTINNGASHTATIGQRPDLQVSVTPVGTFRQGAADVGYTLVVSNHGTGFTSGTVSVADSLPPFMTATAISAGPEWNCALATLTCATSAELAADASYSPITITVTVDERAPTPLINEATVAGGNDVNAANNVATHTTAIEQMPDLTVALSHSGDFRQGQKDQTYTIIVRNDGGTPTAGTVTVTDSVPTGLTITRMMGAGWACDVPTATCTRDTVLAAGDSYSPIIVTVDVADDAPASLTNRADVSGGGEVYTGNNQANDVTTVIPAPDLKVEKSHTGNFTQGGSHEYTIVVSNVGAGPTYGTVTMVDTLPADMSIDGIMATGWVCSLAGTCTRSDELPAGQSYEPIRFLVRVADTAEPNQTNSVTVSGGGDMNTANNMDDDATTVNQRPDLRITKSATGDLTQGQTGVTYTLRVTNHGTGWTGGTVTVTNTLPDGLTAANIDGHGWTCDLATVTCTRSDALARNLSYPDITVTVTVNGDAPPSVTNIADVSGGGDVDTSNNSVTDDTTVIQVADLVVSKSHTGSFRQGMLNATYTVVVENVGPGPTDGAVTVNEILPTGLNPVSISGDGWSCDQTTFSCTRSDVLPSGDPFPAITVTVDVAADAAPTLVNRVQVSGGGEIKTDNNEASDSTTVIQAADMTLTMTHTGDFRQGDKDRTYTITVQNGGAGPTVAMVTVRNTLPPWLTATVMGGTGWTCDLPTLTCTRSDELAAGGTYPPITVTVDVANDAQPIFPNHATVTGGGELNTTNNHATDLTIVTQVADLTVTKSHVGDFTIVDRGAAYTIVVRNVGPGPSDAPVTVTDSLPARLTATDMGGTGWTCDLNALTCTRADSVASGGSYPPITLTVDVVTQGGPGTVTNSVAVSGGGELNSANNTANDQTNLVVPPSGPAPRPPRVTVTAPVSITREASITVSGTANPSAPVQVNGATLQADADGNWSTAVPLQEGPNVITATSGTASASVTVTRDTVPPVLTLTAEETRTDKTTVKLTASSEEDAAIEIEGKRRDHHTVQLKLGRNTFSATATDRAGNTATVTVTVERVDKQPDRTVVEIDPAEGGEVRTEYLQVLLPAQVSSNPLQIMMQTPAPSRATDQANRSASVVAVVAEVTATETADNTPVRDFQKKVRLIFHYDPARVGDPTRLKFYYYDPVGEVWVELGGTVNQENQTVTVDVDHFTLFSVLAPRGLTVEIDSVPDTVTSESLTITGKTQPEQTVRLMLNGNASALARSDKEGRFTLAVKLSEGRNRFYVKGNSDLASREVTVVYQPEPKEPAIELADTEGHWAETNILRMVALGVVRGYEDKTFRPENQVSRLEFAVMVARLLKLAPVNEPLAFTDSDQIPAWAQAQVAAAVKAGIITGRTDGSFDPDSKVTRAEVAIMLTRALKYAGKDNAPGEAAFADSDTIPAWAQDQVRTAAGYGLVTGYPDGTFRPGHTATRAEAVTMLSRLLDAISQ